MKTPMSPGYLPIGELERRLLQVFEEEVPLKDNDKQMINNMRHNPKVSRQAFYKTMARFTDLYRDLYQSQLNIEFAEEVSLNEEISIW